MSASHIDTFIGVISALTGGSAIAMNSFWKGAPRESASLTNQLIRKLAKAPSSFLLLFPIHRGGNHWVLVAAAVGTDICMAAFDSHGASDAIRKTDGLLIEGAVVDAVKKPARLVWLDTPNPQQSDGSSCGVYVCLNALALARGNLPPDSYPAVSVSHARETLRRIFLTVPSPDNLMLVYDAVTGLP